LFPNSFDQNGNINEIAYIDSVDEDDRVRVSFDWNIHVDDDPEEYAYQDLANFDLYVYGPEPYGPLVQYSVSPSQSFEIIDFIAQFSGTYRIALHGANVSADGESYGLAWENTHSLTAYSNGIGTIEIPEIGTVNPYVEKSFSNYKHGRVLDIVATPPA
jgi:hypothetical protein